MKKSELRKIIREELLETELRVPDPKAMDYNELPDVIGFWKWKISDAAHQAGMNDSRLRSGDIGDLIFFLNRVGMRWKELNKRKK